MIENLSLWDQEHFFNYGVYKKTVALVRQKQGEDQDKYPNYYQVLKYKPI